MIWLNGQPEQKHLGRNTKASRERILRLWQTLRDTQAAVAEAGKTIWDLYVNAPASVHRLMRRLDALIAEYPLTPSSEIDLDQNLCIDEIINSDQPLGECSAAHALMWLLNENLLDRIKLCACGKYFFGRSTNQTSCSETCRHKKYERTEAFKRQRREYMRNYYRLKMSGKVK